MAVSKQPYWSFGKLDPVLTEACRLGEFASVPFNSITMQFSGDRGRALMQVVPPLYRHLLVDRRSLARPDCEVRVDAKVRLNGFPPNRHTALPPPDPKAVQKREALIKSWPKTPM